MKKRQLILTLAIAVMMVIMLAGCGTVAMPEKHEIAVPDGYATAQDDLGADSYAGWCDNPETIYFTIKRGPSP